MMSSGGLDVAIDHISQGQFSHTKALREVLTEHVGLLRVFVSCCAILLRVGMEVLYLELFGIVWIEVSKIIVLLGPSQITHEHDSISFSLIAVEEDFGVSWLVCTDCFVFSLP